ncbi:uncharacterized protein BO96DRAFT_490821, partial [Aspergillus niger CBS 101883]|uniref:uncharacterized protein n=1 Tax=Aspergillus lacticoffeatus (strain CBS 101883) TaxID=1450533 RepID=UPI000D7FC096
GGTVNGHDLLDDHLLVDGITVNRGGRQADRRLASPRIIRPAYTDTRYGVRSYPRICHHYAGAGESEACLTILLEAPARRSLWGDMWILDSRPLGSPFVSRFWVLMPTCLIPGVGQCMIAGAALSLLDITVELVSGSLAFSRFVVGTRMQAQEGEGGAGEGAGKWKRSTGWMKLPRTATAPSHGKRLEGINDASKHGNAWSSSWRTLLDYDTLIPKVVPRRRRQQQQQEESEEAVKELLYFSRADREDKDNRQLMVTAVNGALADQTTGTYVPPAYQVGDAAIVVLSSNHQPIQVFYTQSIPGPAIEWWARVLTTAL